MPRRRVFIDCGSNTCKVLEERIALGIDDDYFAFEPQPELALKADDVQKRYPSLNIHFEPKAVWIRNERLEFFLATKWGPNHRGGSTLMQGHTENAAEVDYHNPVNVQAFDFSQWLLRNFTDDDEIVVKMDIEGAEYPVIEKMIADRSIYLVGEMIVEFHWNMNQSIEKDRHEKLLKEISCRTKLTQWH